MRLMRDYGMLPRDILDEITSDLRPVPVDQRINLSEDQKRYEVNVRAIANNAAIIHNQYVIDPAQRALHLAGIFVGSAARGQGAGRKILDNALNTAELIDLSTVQLTASRSHGAAYWAGLGFRPNNPDFNSTFRDPLAIRVAALAPLLSADSRASTADALAMPAHIMPSVLLDDRSDVQFLADPEFKPDKTLLAAYSALYNPKLPVEDQTMVFQFRMNQLRKPDNTLPLSTVLMTQLYYDAELDMTDKNAVAAMRAKIKGHTPQTAGQITAPAL